MVVRLADLVPVGHHPPVVGQLLRHPVVGFDGVLVAEHHGPDAVEVHGRAPHVRRGAEGELVRGRAIAAVDRDVQRRPDRFPEALQVEGEQAHRAGYVARIVAQALRSTSRNSFSPNCVVKRMSLAASCDGTS